MTGRALADRDVSGAHTMCCSLENVRQCGRPISGRPSVGEEWTRLHSVGVQSTNGSRCNWHELMNVRSVEEHRSRFRVKADCSHWENAGVDQLLQNYDAQQERSIQNAGEIWTVLLTVEKHRSRGEGQKLREKTG
ncbi:hypothetical protein BaRGS_00027977, partial [Batillaria attramentaria]